MTGCGFPRNWGGPCSRKAKNRAWSADQPGFLDAAPDDRRAPGCSHTVYQAAASSAEVSNTLLIGGRFMIIG